MVYEPGLYADISNEEYHATAGLSRSALWEFHQLPYKYWFKYLSGKYVKPATPDHFALGSAVHTLTLEPHLYEKEFFVFPKADGRTTAGKAIKAQALLDSQGKTILDEELARKAGLMAESVRSNPDAMAIITGAKIEHSIFWIDERTGILCKSRPDIWMGPIGADLKTCAHADHRSIQREAMNYGYFLQAGMIYEGCHSLGLPWETFIFLCVEKEQPYANAIYLLDDDALRYGCQLFRDLLDKFAECLKQNNWPSYGIETLYAPHWIRTDE